MEKPRCPALTTPQNGNINSSTVALHVGDAVLYQCNPRHSLHGPSVKVCAWDGGNETAFWSPPDKTDCRAERYVCPNLLPQPHGSYSLLKEHFYPEDTVELLCNDGYYIRDDTLSPERVLLRCHGMDWTPSQNHCQTIIQTSVTHNLLDSVEASVWYAVPSLSDLRRLPPNNLYFSLACRNVTGEYDHYSVRIPRSPHSDPLAQTIQCFRKLVIARGPSIYEGILTVSTPKGAEKICIEQHTDALIACNALGYSSYTSKVYHSAVSIPTTLAISSNRTIFPTTSVPCHYRIMCRQSCEAFAVNNGTSCRKSYEGESCHVTCNPGYDLVGSSTLSCDSQGQWTGYLPRCDGK